MRILQRSTGYRTPYLKGTDDYGLRVNYSRHKEVLGEKWISLGYGRNSGSWWTQHRRGSLWASWVSKRPYSLHFKLTGYFTGVCIGLNAALISIVTEWLSDIKMGYCSDGWWLNQQFCCWEIESDETDVCDSWHPWSNVVLGRWFVYVLFAVSYRHQSYFTMCLNLWSDQGIFSFVAGHLVRSLAKYAAGSGISEIKCILAGFVMQGFLGFATFAIKSITLVSISIYWVRSEVWRVS